MGVNVVKSVKYITETNTFTSRVTGETYNIHHPLDCNDKCLVYLLTCNRCKKQYTGQTTDNVRGRWSNYESKSKSFKRGDTKHRKKLELRDKYISKKLRIKKKLTAERVVKKKN